MTTELWAYAHYKLRITQTMQSCYLISLITTATNSHRSHYGHLYSSQTVGHPSLLRDHILHFIFFGHIGAASQINAPSQTITNAHPSPPSSIIVLQDWTLRAAWTWSLEPGAWSRVRSQARGKRGEQIEDGIGDRALLLPAVHLQSLRGCWDYIKP